LRGAGRAGAAALAGSPAPSDHALNSPFCPVAAVYFGSPGSPVPTANPALELNLGVHCPFPISSKACGSPLCCFAPPLFPLLPHHFGALAANFAPAARSQAPFRFPFPQPRDGRWHIHPAPSPGAGPGQTQPHQPAGCRSLNICGGHGLDLAREKPMARQIKMLPLHAVTGAWGSCLGSLGMVRIVHSTALPSPRQKDLLSLETNQANI